MISPRAARIPMFIELGTTCLGLSKTRSSSGCFPSYSASISRVPSSLIPSTTMISIPPVGTSLESTESTTERMYRASLRQGMTIDTFVGRIAKRQSIAVGTLSPSHEGSKDDDNVRRSFSYLHLGCRAHGCLDKECNQRCCACSSP